MATRLPRWQSLTVVNNSPEQHLIPLDDYRPPVALTTALGVIRPPTRRLAALVHPTRVFTGRDDGWDETTAGPSDWIVYLTSRWRLRILQTGDPRLTGGLIIGKLVSLFALGVMQYVGPEADGDNVLAYLPLQRAAPGGALDAL